MNIRYIILLSVFLSIATLSWSQEEFKVIFDDAPTPVRHEIKPAAEDTPSDDNYTFTIRDTIRAHIIEKAREYIGIGYRYGQSNENGFDCSGYVKFVYQSFGFTLPHSSYEQYNKSRRIKDRQALPGDLIFFKTRGAAVSHVGIYLGENLFIHSPGKGKKVSINTLEDVYYKKHFVGFGRYL